MYGVVQLGAESFLVATLHGGIRTVSLMEYAYALV